MKELIIHVMVFSIYTLLFIALIWFMFGFVKGYLGQHVRLNIGQHTVSKNNLDHGFDDQKLVLVDPINTDTDTEYANDEFMDIKYNYLTSNVHYDHNKSH